MNEITIVIPVHDPSAIHRSHLDRLLNSIKNQTEMPKEIILSGNHPNPYTDSIFDAPDSRIPTRYIQNRSNGAAENLNFLLDRVQSPITKIMFQDDYFYEKDALRIMKDRLLKDETNWVVSGCNHFYENTGKIDRIFHPKFSNKLLRGRNSIGAPSVVMLETTTTIRFHEQMVYMFDCEWYLQMRHKLGKPSIVKSPLVTIGIHSNQATNWAKLNLESEVKLTKDLHPRKFYKSGCKRCAEKVMF